MSRKKIQALKGRHRSPAPAYPRGSRRGRCDAAPIRGLPKNTFSRSRGHPGAYATGLYDFAPPSGALNILVSINRNWMKAMPVSLLPLVGETNNDNIFGTFTTT